jgi:hypothetical protein
MSNNKIVSKLSPSKSGSDKVTEGCKLFVFNETGNIMVSTTATHSETIEQDVRDVFNEV